MIQTILRFTCDECGAVQDVERTRVFVGRTDVPGYGTDREALQAASCFQGKLKDRCARCEEKRLLETG